MVAVAFKTSKLRARPVNKTNAPRPEFRAPDYSPGRKTVLHRFLDAQFVPRFIQDLNSHNLDDHSWMSQDRMGEFQDEVTLRQPIHRTFYMISTEVVCGKPGKPALDTKHIISAGFVIRRQDVNGFSIWRQENGQAVGWQPQLKDEELEPDVYRRLCNAGVVEKRFPPPPYSGEETHPLHVNQSRDRQGRLRTILYGYLPIGGNYIPKSQTTLTGAAREELFATLPWPSGNNSASPYSPNSWSDSDGVLAMDGKASRRLVKLLRIAVNRYHIFDSSRTENTELMNKLHTLTLHCSHGNLPESLGQALEGMFADNEGEALHDWIAKATDLENASYETHPDDDNILLDVPLPFGPHDAELKVSQADAEEINMLMSWRLEQQILDVTRDMPLPKFEQAESDRYYVQPFVRIKECCNEEIIWGEASQLFRVAAPFDPEASRPSMIQMPSFNDLKRGIANGLGIVTPPDMADKLRALKPDEGVSDKVIGIRPALGLNMICSFSLPVITICAMILLMILISLLNLVFRWIPWCFSCIPFPSVKKGE